MGREAAAVRPGKSGNSGKHQHPAARNGKEWFGACTGHLDVLKPVSMPGG